MITDLLNDNLTRIFIAGILISIIAGTLGVFVTLKKQAFLSDGVAHASLSGIAVGIFFGLAPIPFAVLVGVLMSIVITFMKSRIKISYDSIIGIIYTFLFALGVMFLSFSGGDAHELEEFLLGSIDTVEWIYIASLFILIIIISLFVILNYKKLAYMTFDEEAAKVRGVKTVKYEYITNILLSVFIIIGIKSVGLILITALLIIPAVFAKYFSKSFHSMIPISIIFSLIITTFSLAISILFDLPASAMIVIMQASVLFIALSLRKYIVPLFK